MIFKSYHSNRPNKNGDYYIGSLTEEQRFQIDTIYNKGEVNALKHVLKGFELKDYQTMLASIAYISKQFIVGADTGLGKSLIISLYLKIHKAKGTLNNENKALVVTTTSSLQQIKSVIENSTGMKVIEINGNAKNIIKQLSRPDFTDYEVYIVANSVFSKSVEFNRMFGWFVNQFNTFILDESMVAAGDKSIVGESLRSWAKLFEYKMLLNATVIEKTLAQPYNQIKLLDPNILEPYEQLERRYATKSRGKLIYRDLDKFFDNLKYFFCNIDRQDIGATFEYEDILIPVHMTPLQAQIQDSRNYWYALFSPTTQADTSVIPFTREGLPYLNTVMNILRHEFQLHDKGIVIYADPTAMKPLLKREIEAEFPGVNVGIVDGSEREFRQYSIEAFNDGRSRVLITNIPEALDLHNGAAMVFLTIPSKHYQARGRIARGLNDGEGKKLRYYYPVYLKSKQLEYIKDTLSADERTLTGALTRHIQTSRNLAQKLKQITP